MVVVVLNEADAHGVQVIYDPHEMLPYNRLAEVHEALPPPDGMAVTGQECFGVGHSKIRARISGLHFQPHTGEHASESDLVQDTLQATFPEQLVHGLPVAVVLVPLKPLAEPACVDAEDLASYTGGGLHQGNEAVTRGLSP